MEPVKEKHPSADDSVHPVNIGGVVSRASGCNARFILRNSIGTGCLITVQRSGDVIPQVVSAIQGNISSNDLLTVLYDPTDPVNFVALQDNEQSCVASLLHFLKVIGVKGMQGSIYWGGAGGKLPPPPQNFSQL